MSSISLSEENNQKMALNQSSIQTQMFVNAALNLNATISELLNFSVTIGSLVNNSGLSDSVNNKTNDSVFPYEDRPETYIVPVVFFLIFVVGVIGNGTLVIIFLRHKNMRNVPNTYILSLALADLLVIVTSVPFTSVIYTLPSWPWGELICKISETAKDISVAVSVFTLTALSADRFFAIVDPLKKFHTSSGGKKATRITLCIAFSIWVFAIICAAPAAAGSYLRGFPDDGAPDFWVCYPYPLTWLNGTYPQVMVMTKFLILYVVPLTIIAIFYLSMAVYLILSTRNVPGEMQGMHRQIKARKKVAVMVLIFVGIFAVCLAPVHIVMLFFYFHPKAQELYNAFWHYFRIIGFCLFFFHSCANPVALYFVSGAFRKYFNRYLLCKKVRKSRCNTYQQPQHTTSMSLVSMKRNQSTIRNRRTASINQRMDPMVIQETSVTLLGNGNDHFCSRI